MIVGCTVDPIIRSGLLLAAHREEDVVLDPGSAEEALACGYPRVVVYDLASGFGRRSRVLEGVVPLLPLTPRTLSEWESERLSAPGRVDRVEWLARRLSQLMPPLGSGAPSWVDKALADLSRAAGLPLPPPLRSFGRRVMEFPSHYQDLSPLASACGVTPGALKARFRRRGLPSPSGYLRWFRMMAVASALADRDVTVAQAANRLGFTSDGNLCRAMLSLTRVTPTEARTLHGWNRLVIRFAWSYLNEGAVQTWRELDDLFLRRAA